MTQVEAFVRRVRSIGKTSSAHIGSSARKSLPLAAVASMSLILLSGCGSSGGPSASPTVVATETPVPAIPIVTPTPGVPGSAGSSGSTPQPGTTPTPNQSTNGQNGTYTVQQGDTLYQIAVKFNVTLQALMAANSITDPASIQAGQVIVIPPH